MILVWCSIERMEMKLKPGVYAKLSESKESTDHEHIQEGSRSGSLKKATIRLMYVLFGACFFVALPCYGFIKIESKMIKLKSQK